jgi:hypothetical protein
VGVGEVEVEIAEEGFVVSFVLENGTLLDTTVENVVVGTRLIFFDTIF